MNKRIRKKKRNSGLHGLSGSLSQKLWWQEERRSAAIQRDCRRLRRVLWAAGAAGALTCPRPLRHGNGITGYCAMEKRHSQHYGKKQEPLPRPANSVSHSSIRQPVTHIPTTPTMTETDPFRPVIRKANLKGVV